MTTTLTPAQHAARRLGATIAADRAAIEQAAADAPAAPSDEQPAKSRALLALRANAVRSIDAARAQRAKAA